MEVGTNWAGDYSRFTFDEAKRYFYMMKVQGVPVLDDEFNVAQEINITFLRRLIIDMFGDGATNDGFKIVGTGAINDFTVMGGDGTLDGAGHFYVGGYLLIQPADVAYSAQEIIPTALTTPSAGRTDEVYLDVYLDEIDTLEDPNIKDPVLSLETSRRLKLKYEVKVAEGSVTPASYKAANGVTHYTAKLAVINRTATNTIDANMVVDVRPIFGGVSTLAEGITKLIHPDASKGFGDLYKQGVYPAMFNQQWGGANYGGLPDGSFGEVATGFIQTDSSKSIFTNIVAGTYISQGFKVGQTTNLKSVWVKIYKIGNPANSLQLSIYSDNAGSPNAVITNGIATAQSGKLHTNNTDGEWVKFIFPVAPGVLGGTQYHIVMNSSGAVDAANYWAVPAYTAGYYPHGIINFGDATPAWTPSDARILFLIEPATTILQSDALLGDGKLACFEGATLDQSGGFVTANDNFLNHKTGSLIVTGAGFTKDKTILDVGTGIDNNRIVLRCDITTGYASVTLYTDNEIVFTLTGTTDVSVGDHVLGFVYRAEGDGADFLKLIVDGVPEDLLVNQTITLNESFAVDGHTTIGGGFSAAPTWTQNLDMSVLPSAAGWTWAGAAVESNAMSVADGILYQNSAGYASTDDGYYTKTTTLNNTTGWIIEATLKIKNIVTLGSGATIAMSDGTKQIKIIFGDYYGYTTAGGYTIYFQHDFTRKSTVRIAGKGSDFYLWINNKLVIDGTAQLKSANTVNYIALGDTSIIADTNASIEWHHLKYYEAVHMPEFTNGSISEMAYWAGDKSAYFPTIYNSGIIQSVKALAGIDKNYIEKVTFRKEVKGIVSDPATTSLTPVLIPDLCMFVLGDKFIGGFTLNHSNPGTPPIDEFGLHIDGVLHKPTNRDVTASGGYTTVSLSNKIINKFNGLHIIEATWFVYAGTVNSWTVARYMSVEGE